MRKLILPAALLTSLALAGCSAGGNTPEPSKAAESTPAAAQPTPSPVPSSDVQAIETSATSTEEYAYPVLTDKELNALPTYLQDVYNQCMVDQWQFTLDAGTEYDEAQSSSYCQVVMDMNEGLEGVTQEQFDELTECLQHMETERPELFVGYDSWLEALEQQDLKEACWEYMGMM